MLGQRSPSVETLARLAMVFGDDPPVRSARVAFSGPWEVIRLLALDPALSEPDRRRLVAQYLAIRSRGMRIVAERPGREDRPSPDAVANRAQTSGQEAT